MPKPKPKPYMIYKASDIEDAVLDFKEGWGSYKDYIVEYSRLLELCNGEPRCGFYHLGMLAMANIGQLKGVEPK